MALLLGSSAVVATMAGGALALLRRDKLHLILGFSAGAVLGVSLFDLLPESLDLAAGRYGASTVALFVAVGFFVYLLVNRVLLLQSAAGGVVGAASLSLHSFLDGVGIGLAFQVSTSLGAVVAAAVLAHDFSDGINTVTIVLRNHGKTARAFAWLAVDALAPLLGVSSTYFYTLSDSHLGVVLAVFCGFFLYIGASDLLPESHHRHPKALTSAANILGAGLIWFAIHFASL